MVVENKALPAHAYVDRVNAFRGKQRCIYWDGHVTTSKQDNMATVVHRRVDCYATLVTRERRSSIVETIMGALKLKHPEGYELQMVKSQRGPAGDAKGEQGASSQVRANLYEKRNKGIHR